MKLNININMNMINQTKSVFQCNLFDFTAGPPKKNSNNVKERNKIYTK